MSISTKSNPPTTPSRVEAEPPQKAATSKQVAQEPQKDDYLNELTTVAAPKAYPEEEVEDISEEIDLMKTETTPAPDILDLASKKDDQKPKDDTSEATSTSGLDADIAVAVEEAIGTDGAGNAESTEPVFERMALCP